MIKKSSSKSLRQKKRKRVVIKKSEFESRKVPILRKAKIYLRLINFKNLNYQIQSYGFDYSLGKYMASIIILMTLIVSSAYIFHLQIQYILALVLIAFMMLPIIVLSQIRYLHNNFKFEQITTYLQEMITVFKMKPKILYALTEVSELFDSGIKTDIELTIDNIKGYNSVSSSYGESLAIIERKYPCSRIQSLHSLLISVENQNSTNYKNSINDLYEDIHCWINRTYDYQIQLKNMKFQFSIILILTIGVSAAMVNILPASMTSFVQSGSYQTVTTLMLIVFLGMFCFVQSKLNGQWLINDMSNDEAKILKSIMFVESFDKKKNFKDSLVRASIVSIVPIVGLLIGNQNIIMIGVLGTVFMYFQNELKYKSNFKILEKEIKKTFPIWLRDVSLSMHNYVVTRAIKQSYDTAPTVIKYYLEAFIDEVEKDPMTIRPYNHFLQKFYITDVTSAMKTLYSIKQQDAEGASKQISDLIIRNQSLMETSEKIKNENQMAGMSMIGGVPMLIGSFKLMFDMILMLGTFMSMMQISM